jgi:hypothetical protein
MCLEFTPFHQNTQGLLEHSVYKPIEISSEDAFLSSEYVTQIK